MAAVERAINEQQKSRGLIPAQYQQMIDELFKPPVIPWYKVLSRLLHSSLINKRDTSFIRPLKSRLALYALGEEVALYPSSRKLPGYTIGVAIDTSGSMSEEDLKLAANELIGIADQYPGSKIIVIQCDAAIEREFELVDSEELDPKRNPQITYICGRGGTDFEPPFVRFVALEKVPEHVYANKEVYEDRIRDFPSKFDAVVYFTDGIAPAPSVNLFPKCPVFWVITPRGNADCAHNSFGKALFIEQEKG